MDKGELKQFRENNGLTQVELSKALSVAGNTVSRWELGMRAIPSFLPLALETIERRLSKVKGESAVGSSDISVSDSEKPIKGLPGEYTLTVKAVGKLLDRSPRQVRTYAGSGELKGKQGKQNHWFFRQIDVDDYIQSTS